MYIDAWKCTKLSVHHRVQWTYAIYNNIMCDLCQILLRENGSCAGLGRTSQVPRTTTVAFEYFGWACFRAPFSCSFPGRVYKYPSTWMNFPLNPKTQNLATLSTRHVSVCISSFEKKYVPFAFCFTYLHMIFHFHACVFFDRAACTTG